MRRRSSLLRIAAAILVVAVVAGCASARVPPMGYQGQPFRPEADEGQLWAEADQEAEKLEKLNKIYDDPLLDEYLAKVADRLIPGEVKAAGAPGFRFVVFRDPTLNAFAMPNGRVFIHTGLLARLENEAQLATILGRELTHVTHRHMLKAYRDGGSTRLLIGAALAAEDQARGGDAGNIFLGLGLTLAHAAAVTGYNRDLEREADEEGLAHLVRAGYDPREAPRIFELLRMDHGEGGTLETFFFGSHSRLAERIEETNRLLETRYVAEAAEPNRTVNTEEFGLRLRSVVRENALLDLRAGRFNLAQAQLDRVLALTPRDPIAQLYYGDLYRLQAQRAKEATDRERLARLAVERYERSAGLDPAFADPFRQLGYLHYQQGERARAREAFEQYLARNPAAPDARRIKEYLLELDR